MLGVVEVCPVQGLALAFVDRPRVAVPEALEVGGGPSHLPPLLAGRVQRRSDLARCGVQPRDGADIAVVDAELLVCVGELHPVAHGEGRAPVLRLKLYVAPGQLAPVAPHLAQLGVQGVHVAVGVGEHKPALPRLLVGIPLPRRHKGAAGLVLFVGPCDRPGFVERTHGLGKAAFGQIARRLALPVHALPRHLGDFGRTVPLPQLREHPAALDAGELAVVAGEDDFCPGLTRGGQQLARHARVEHRRFVHHDHGALVPLRAPVLDREQRGMDGARLAESVLC